MVGSGIDNGLVYGYVLYGLFDGGFVWWWLFVNENLFY